MTNKEKFELRCLKHRMKEREKRAKEYVRVKETEETICFHAKAIERIIQRQCFPGCEIKVTMEAIDHNKDNIIFKMETNPKQGIGHSIEVCARNTYYYVKDYKEDEYPSKKSQSHD